MFQSVKGMTVFVIPYPNIDEMMEAAAYVEWKMVMKITAEQEAQLLKRCDGCEIVPKAWFHDDGSIFEQSVEIYKINTKNNTCELWTYVALKYMKQEDAALDVLQDSYIKAFQNLEQLQDAEKFSAWFSKVVATKALDELKKKKAVLFSQMELETEDSSIESLFLDDRIDTQPDLSLDKEETSRLVQEMIDTLSDEQRICVTMYYVEEMTVKEMAETLGVSENTVKSRLNYARKNIKEKVLELEKKGTKLYGLAPIPFFLYLLLSDSINVQAAELPVGNILDNAASEAIKAQKRAGRLTQIGGGEGMELLTKKIIIGIVSAVVVIGGTTAGIMAYNLHQDKIAEEAMAIEMEKAAEEAAMQTEELMNDKELLEQMSEETVTEKSEETATQPVEPQNEVDSTEPQVTEPVEAASQFTYTDLEQVMYAKSSVNVRDLPNSDGNKLGGLSTAQEVSVTGQCNETGWYRFNYNGSEAFLSNSYLVKEKPAEEVVQKSEEQPAQSGDYWLTGYWVNCCGAGNNGPQKPNGDCPYSTGTVVEETNEYFTMYLLENHGAWKDGEYIDLEPDRSWYKMIDYADTKFEGNVSFEYLSACAYNQGCVIYIKVKPSN